MTFHTLSNICDRELLRSLTALADSDPSVALLIKRFETQADELEDIKAAEDQAKSDAEENHNQFQAMRDICWYFEWSNPSKGLYNITGLHRDIHPDNHQVSVTAIGKRLWHVEVCHGRMGEKVDKLDKFRGSLKDAKNAALELAAQVIINGSFLNYSSDLA